jgi:hypothetical protein
MFCWHISLGFPQGKILDVSRHIEENAEIRWLRGYLWKQGGSMAHRGNKMLPWYTVEIWILRFVFAIDRPLEFFQPIKSRALSKSLVGFFRKQESERSPPVFGGKSPGLIFWL